MQRQSLLPLHRFMQDRGMQGSGTSLLEVACGTGRFATFIKVRLPFSLLLLPVNTTEDHVCATPSQAGCRDDSGK